MWVYKQTRSVFGIKPIPKTVPIMLKEGTRSTFTLYSLLSKKEAYGGTPLLGDRIISFLLFVKSYYMDIELSNATFSCDHLVSLKQCVHV